jgi:hypothetical protein
MEVGAVPRESPPAPSTPPARAAITDGTAGAGARTSIAAAQMAVPTGTAIALASTSTLVRYPAGQPHEPRVLLRFQQCRSEPRPPTASLHLRARGRPCGAEEI